MLNLTFAQVAQSPPHWPLSTTVAATASTTTTTTPSTTTADSRYEDLLKLFGELESKVTEGKGTTSSPVTTPAPVDEDTLRQLVQDLVVHHTKTLVADVHHVKSLHEDANLTLATLAQDLLLWKEENMNEVS